MKSNVVSVSIWGQEICKLEWRGGYKPGFGKLGAVVSFASGYASLPWDLDPLGFYREAGYGEERAVTQSLLMKVAEENDIKKAKGIISEVLEAVRSFPAEGIQIPAFASKLISEHIQSKIQKLNQ